MVFLDSQVFLDRFLWLRGATRLGIVGRRYNHITVGRRYNQFAPLIWFSLMTRSPLFLDWLYVLWFLFFISFQSTLFLDVLFLFLLFHFYRFISLGSMDLLILCFLTWFVLGAFLRGIVACTFEEKGSVKKLFHIFLLNLCCDCEGMDE